MISKFKQHGQIADEFYFSCTASSATSPEKAIAVLRDKYNQSLQSRNLLPDDVILQLFFCSDPCSHKPVIDSLWPISETCLRAYVGQEPLNSLYISLLAYAIKNVKKKLLGTDCLEVKHGCYTSLWSQHIPANTASRAKEQNDNVISGLQTLLQSHGLSLAQNVYRTWYYVRDIDNNYAEMVRSRIHAYETAGLSPQTHFIASTGIDADAPDPHVLIILRSHAIQGLQSEQVTYLKALDFLSPTHMYGVNFERATRVTYGDRLHCHISGTASIDAMGQVVHKGDVVRQCERALCNVEALLNEGGMKLDHLKSAIVYLRDGHEYQRVAPVVHAVVPPDCALIFTRAPVCRPDWLVEIEGEAIKPCHTGYPAFV